jgi:regulator of replication initiation timing
MATESYVTQLEAQCSTLKFQAKKLCLENEWLRGELEIFQTRWRSTESRCAELEEQKAQLLLMNDMKQFDCDGRWTPEQVGVGTS